MSSSYLCPSCSERFSTAKNFDRHRVGSFVDQPPDFGKRCLSPKDMEHNELKLNDRGVWVSSKPVTKSPRYCNMA